MPAPPEPRKEPAESRLSYSLDEVLQKFAEQEARLESVVAQLAAETARHSTVLAKLESTVLEQFAEPMEGPLEPLDIPSPSADESGAAAAAAATAERHPAQLFRRRSADDRAAGTGTIVLEPASAPKRGSGRKNIFRAADTWWKSLKQANKELSAQEGGRSFTDRMRGFLSSFMADVALGLVIAANMAVMFCEHQWSGYECAMALGKRTDDFGWAEAEPTFEILEMIFVSIYLLDVILRMIFLPLSRLRQPLNLFDTIVVVVCAIDVYILRPAGVADLEALIILRLIRAARILRVVRVLKFMRLFHNLHVLIETLSSMMVDLLWGCLLLTTIIVTAGLFLGTLTQSHILDDSLDPTTREFLYARFAHATSASYYLFEAALTSAWVTSAGPMIFDVSSLFALFWVPYVIMVNFAVTRVIAALFLKSTLEVAAREKEKVANEAKKKKDKVAKRLKHIFKLADGSGDGCVELEDFRRMLDEPDVLEHLEEMELNHNEMRALVDLLSEGGKPVPISDFLHAALTMNDTARTIHMMQTSIDVARIERAIVQLGARQNALLQKLSPVSLEATVSAV